MTGDVFKFRRPRDPRQPRMDPRTLRAVEKAIDTLRSRDGRKQFDDDLKQIASVSWRWKRINRGPPP